MESIDHKVWPELNAHPKVTKSLRPTNYVTRSRADAHTCTNARARSGVYARAHMRARARARAHTGFLGSAHAHVRSQAHRRAHARIGAGAAPKHMHGVLAIKRCSLGVDSGGRAKSGVHAFAAGDAGDGQEAARQGRWQESSSESTFRRLAGEGGRRDAR
eukprot:6018847-Pleurochrysis_carterae.AAC.1